MKNKTSRTCIPVLLLISGLQLQACHTTHHSVQTTAKDKVLISELRTDWLQYKVFRIPENEKKSNLVRLSIRVVNTKDNTSPLRKMSTDLEQYNIRYEYLLNSAKNELYLEDAKGITYPVSYSFENNYNAFPFETINVGYQVGHLKKGTRLVYVDRVFAQDTLYFRVK